MSCIRSWTFLGLLRDWNFRSADGQVPFSDFTIFANIMNFIKLLLMHEDASISGRSLLLKLWLRYFSRLENDRVRKAKEHFTGSGLKTFRARRILKVILPEASLYRERAGKLGGQGTVPSERIRKWRECAFSLPLALSLPVPPKPRQRHSRGIQNKEFKR